MTPEEVDRRKQLEDECVRLVESWDVDKRDIVYKILNVFGHRIGVGYVLVTRPDRRVGEG